MNILYLCDEYPPCQHGGIGTVIQTLARAIALKGHNVIVAGFYPYYRKAAARENDQGVEVYRFFYGNKWKLILSKNLFTGHLVNIKSEFKKYVSKIKKLVDEYKIDIIESTDFNEAFRYSGPFMIQFPDFGVPLIVKLHGSYSIVYDYRDTKFGNANIPEKEKNLLNLASGLIAVSASVKQRTEEKYKIAKKIDILNNGILLSKLPLYKTDINRNCVVFAGTIDENKGIFNLVRAWERVIDVIPSAELLVYGKGSELTINAIFKLIANRNIKSIQLKGFVNKEELQIIYKSASCAIFPSYAETFGMAPLEAMAVGCPTIFTKRTSGPEIIENGIDGLLVDPDNTQEISEAILFLLINKQNAIEIGKKGYQKVLGKFDIFNIADQHLLYYKKFIV